MAYFGYDDRYGCRVSDESYTAPPTEEQLAAARAAKISAVVAENKAVIALTPADVLGCKVRSVDDNAPFTFAYGIEISIPCKTSDTGWRVGYTYWACTSESQYDTAEIAMSPKAFTALLEVFQALALGKELPAQVATPTPSPVVSGETESAAIAAGYELFLQEWEEKHPARGIAQGIPSFIGARKGQRVMGRNKAAEAAIRSDVCECKEDGSYQATAEWYADLFWDHS